MPVDCDTLQARLIHVVRHGGHNMYGIGALRPSSRGRLLGITLAVASLLQRSGSRAGFGHVIASLNLDWRSRHMCRCHVLDNKDPIISNRLSIDVQR